MTFWHLTFDKVDEETKDITPQRDDKPEQMPFRDESNEVTPLRDENKKPELRTLREGLNRIETTLRISDDDKVRIEEAVRIIFNKDAACLKRIKKILLNENPDSAGVAAEAIDCR